MIARHRPVVRLAACVTLLLSVGRLTAGEPRLTLRAEGRPASAVLAMASEILGCSMRLDHDLLAERLAERRLDLELVQAGRDGVAQAIAHALGCWWCPTVAGEVLFTRSRQVPPAGPLTASNLTSNVEDGERCETAVRRLMEPWIGTDCGLTFHGDQNRWLATLDRTGHDQLRLIVSILERPDPVLPSLIAHPAQPAPDRELPVAVLAERWPDLLHATSVQTGLGFSLGTDLATLTPKDPLHLPPGRLDELPRILARLGVQARWVAGILCLDRTPVLDRRHPGLRRRLAVIPIPQFGDHTAGELLAARLERDAVPAWWSQSGAGILYLAKTRSLFVAADDDALAAIHALLAGMERERP